MTFRGGSMDNFWNHTMEANNNNRQIEIHSLFPNEI